MFSSLEKLLWLLLSVSYLHAVKSNGMLYPRDSESRESKLLDGIWHFRVDNSTNRNQGFEEKWWTKSLFEVSHCLDLDLYVIHHASTARVGFPAQVRLMLRGQSPSSIPSAQPTNLMQICLIELMTQKKKKTSKI